METNKPAYNELDIVYSLRSSHQKTDALYTPAFLNPNELNKDVCMYLIPVFPFE